MKKYDVALIQKDGESGLTKAEVVALFDAINTDEVFPLEILAKDHECSAMGFISAQAADELFDYDYAALSDFVAEILDDVEKETASCEYELNGARIFLGYTVSIS